MLSTKKKKRKTRVDHLAKHLKRTGKRAFTPGGSGASLTKRDKVDVEMGIDYQLRLRIPPIRTEEVLDKEAFKQKLVEGRTKRPQLREDVPLSKADFKKLLLSGQYLTRRRRRTATERRIAALEYFGTIEEKWWLQQQLNLLFYFDRKREAEDQKAYKRWFNHTAPIVARAINNLRDQGKHEEAQELQDYFEELMDEIRPRKIQLTSLRQQLRRLALEGDFVKMRQFCEELLPLRLALEPKKKQKKTKQSKKTAKS